MHNPPYCTIFKGFSIFLGLFTSILSYFVPQIALDVPNTPESGICYIYSIILYRSKSNWRDGDHFIEIYGALGDFGPFSGKIGGSVTSQRGHIFEN